VRYSLCHWIYHSNIKFINLSNLWRYEFECAGCPCIRKGYIRGVAILHHRPPFLHDWGWSRKEADCLKCNSTSIPFIAAFSCKHTMCNRVVTSIPQNRTSRATCFAYRCHQLSSCIAMDSSYALRNTVHMHSVQVQPCYLEISLWNKAGFGPLKLFNTAPE